MNNPRQPPVPAGPRGGNEPNNNNNTRNKPPSITSSEAALTGAATAFINGLPRDELVKFVNRRSPQPPPPPVKTTSQYSPQPPPVNTTSQYSHSKSSSFSSVQSDQQQREHAPSRQSSYGGHFVKTYSPVPANGTRNNHGSLAAALAAVRSSPGTSSAGYSDGRRRNGTSPAPSVRARGGSGSTASGDRLDETPIAATTSLVKLFEGKKEMPVGKVNEEKKEMPVGKVNEEKKEMPVGKVNEKKEMPVGKINEEKKEVPVGRIKEAQLQGIKEVPMTRVKTPPAVVYKPPALQSPTLQSPTPQRRSSILATSPPPLFPPASHQPLHVQVAAKELLQDTGLNLATDIDDDDSPDSYASAKEAFSPIEIKKQSLPLPRTRTRQPAQNAIPITDMAPPTTRSTPIPIVRPPSTSSHTMHSHTSRSQPSIAAAYHQMHPRRITPLPTGDSLANANSLANAIVASSLASSRAASPHKAPPVPAPRHKTASVSHSLFSRTPSPPKKGMRQTMRRTPSASSDEEDVPFAKHKKKKRFIRKHPNKHHEGDRKRWRDAVTERERKRYEGLWAANRGLHMFHTPEEQDFLGDPTQSVKHVENLCEAVADEVVDIVVRDIWSRSRLHNDVLEQVWHLVDTQHNGRLSKEEFVVGLWLIDQSLKGRKLPVKVSESVWSSVKFLQGIKVRSK